MVRRWFLIGWVAVVGCGLGVGGEAPRVDSPDIPGGFHFPEGLGPQAEDPRFGELVRALESDLILNGGVGLSVAIVIDGELRHSAGVGRRSRNPNALPVDEHTLFALGSTTELVTAAAMMQLVKERRLSVDGSLGPLLRDVDVQPRGVTNALTLHQLLTHTSGLGFPDGASVLPIDWGAPTSLRALYDRATFPTWSPPGIVFNRQWIGAGLAARLAEVVTGEFFTDVSRGRVLEPFGMDDATYEPVEASARAHAVGVTGSRIDPVDILPTHPGFVALPTTGLFASATDLGHLAAALVGGRNAMDAEAAAAMMTPHVDTQNAFYRSQGYGMMVWEDDGVWLTASAASENGYGSLIMMAPEHGFAVALQTNADWHGLSYGAYRAFEIFLGKRIQLFNGQETSPSARRAFEGTYFDPHRLGRVRVVGTEQGLTATFENFGHESPLTQVAANVFWFGLNGAMEERLGTDVALVTFFENPEDGCRYFVTGVGVATRGLQVVP